MSSQKANEAQPDPLSDLDKSLKQFQEWFKEDVLRPVTVNVVAPAYHEFKDHVGTPVYNGATALSERWEKSHAKHPDNWMNGFRDFSYPVLGAEAVPPEHEISMQNIKREFGRIAGEWQKAREAYPDHSGSDYLNTWRHFMGVETIGKSTLER